MLATLLLQLLVQVPVHRLDAPVRIFELKEPLTEISDLSTAADGQSLWAVDDEQGTLFRLSASDGSIVQTLSFAKKGDFEGVAAAGERVIAARSDGTLFLVDPAGGKPERLEPRLPKSCDLEGLALDTAKQRLLLACKTPRGDGGKREWPIYASGGGGTRAAVRLKTFLDRAFAAALGEATPEKLDVMPNAACGDTVLLELTRNVGVLLVNSQWWMHDGLDDPQSTRAAACARAPRSRSSCWSPSATTARGG